ncbi:MAG: lipopolysaccharide assembly protein LapB [Gammaproteobacteria bacterium]|uniref:lipopolysaccharide assembly protein LapB n=1 Tax=Pseudomaricurvus alcaniphilus TaxID=1166482 RepID=UPI0014088C8D|nr:lipopolysaccharide assembly protein LapB [Pseudomaricurvus alcaniphilus]MBR9910090.1 lipopolysaccharide assembly protein LapB [Gammaproteobacteria bacterium]NHN36606.1 lipopolysaccharide assembly protein LapB [Pseudomaricurvus alcaniphilus]
MFDWGLLLLLLAAIAIGYFLGLRSRRQNSAKSGPTFEPHYIQGLNYLLSERQDAAIDTFIDALEVNSDTLETHLALGNMLRKRGEVDRAIKIHQNLLARPGLGEEQSLQVQLELARDFIRAGLLDRAELLLLELMNTSSAALRSQCLQDLIEIYRDEKEWQKGISAINQLSGRRFSRLQDKWRRVQAHYYCELAEEALQRSDYLVARRLLRSAMGADKQSARASLLLGRLELRLGQPVEALKALKQVFYQDAALVGEALPIIAECYAEMGATAELAAYLDERLAESGSVAIALARAQLLRTEQGAQAAAEFLGQQRAPGLSLQAAGTLLHYQLEGQSCPDTGLQTAAAVVDRLLKALPQYRCQQCGFGGQQLHWLCPSCKTWGAVKPVDG